MNGKELNPKEEGLLEINLEEIYKLLTQADIPEKTLDLIEKRISERYLSYLYEPNLEDQLVNLCKGDPQNTEMNIELMQLSTGIKMGELYPLPKDCMTILLRHRCNSRLKTP